MIVPQKRTAKVKIVREKGGQRRSVADAVAVEEPMEIRLEIQSSQGPRERSVAITMRTPGDDFELAAGFLFTEGILEAHSQLADLRYCQSEEPQEFNIVTARLRAGVAIDESLLNRNFYVSSSCGVCGKASLEAVEVLGCAPLPVSGTPLDAEIVKRAPALLLEKQRVFGRTGGIHAAGLYSAEGTLETVREDVGRHNAVDKVVGHAFLADRLPLSDRFLTVSGRSSFEILQKALLAGIPTVVAVGAPSSLAVDFARRFNMTLLGFARDDGFNIYSGAERIG